jgi:very-short-patch-repair endonuclease
MKYPDIKKTTQKLRNNATPAEQILWKYIRKKQLAGRKLLRQHAIIYETIDTEHFFYVPDFYCYAEKLAIELDGEIHDFTKERDQKRDGILIDMGIKVLRLKNFELDNIEEVLEKIKGCFRC